MIKYKHLLTFRMVDFNGNVAYDTAEIIETTTKISSKAILKN